MNTNIIVNFPTNFGDAVLVFPAVDRLKATYPSSMITAIVSPKTKDLIERHNSVVPKDATVAFLGDIGFCALADIQILLNRMNGYKIGFLGNHDMRRKRGTLALYDESYPKWADYHYADTRFRLSHGPFYEERGTAAQPPSDGVDWLIHGHCHKLWTVKDNMINVGLPMWDYKPVSMEQIMLIVNCKDKGLLCR